MAGTTLEINWLRPILRPVSGQKHILALTAVSKQMRNETLPLLYSNIRCAYNANTRSKVSALDTQHEYFEGLKHWLLNFCPSPQLIKTFHLALGTIYRHPSNHPSTHLCIELSRIASLFIDTQTTCTWEMAMEYEHVVVGSAPQKSTGALQLPLKATSVSEYTMAECAEKTRALTSSYRERKITSPEYQHAQSDLQKYRKHAGSLLIELAKKLKTVGQGQVHPLDNVTEGCRR